MRGISGTKQVIVHRLRIDIRAATVTWLAMRFASN